LIFPFVNEDLSYVTISGTEETSTKLEDAIFFLQPGQYRSAPTFMTQVSQNWRLQVQVYRSVSHGNRVALHAGQWP
jgi:hypothetical protein